MDMAITEARTEAAPARGATSAVRPTQFAFSLAGLPTSSWGFAVRLWIAVTISLLTSFWLQLEAPSSGRRITRWLPRLRGGSIGIHRGVDRRPADRQPAASV